VCRHLRERDELVTKAERGHTPARR
jgi:hypothetical protein